MKRFKMLIVKVIEHVRFFNMQPSLFCTFALSALPLDRSGRRNALVFLKLNASLNNVVRFISVRSIVLA
jgi:hypothetical protein